MDSSQKDTGAQDGVEGAESVEGVEGTESKIQALEAQVAKLTDLAARAQADLQNSKIRMEREAEDLRKYAVVPLLLALLPVRDDLARASQSGEKGVKQILDKLDKVFSNVGLKCMDALGKPVDPSRHEIINAGSGEKDIVTAIHEEGYELHGRVLRPAKVQVGNGGV